MLTLPKKRTIKKSSKRGRGRGGTRPATRKRPAKKSLSADKLLPALKPGDCGALLLIRDAAGDSCDEAVGVVSTGPTKRRSGSGRGGGAARRSPAKTPRIRKTGAVGPEVCQALAAVGHQSRAKLLCKLLDGPATYGSLQRVTKLKAGPLYHHINHLRLARLILPKQRDLYELTRGGRNLILSVMVLATVIRDGRRRPVPTK